jgi:hypothetical protein
VPAITQPIVFAIGQTGAAKAKGQFLLLGAAMVAAGVALAKVVKSSEEYQQVLRNVTTDMSEFNNHTAAQIDTLVSLQEVVKLQNAGHRLTAKELRAVGVAAVKYNQSIGGGPGGSTEIFKKLVKSIVKGTDMALVPMGIQLDQTTDKFLAGQEAVEKLTAKFGELSVAIETGEEALFALDNNWGTLVDQQTAWVVNTDSVLGALNTLVDATGAYSTIVDETGGRVNDLTANFAVQTELLGAHIQSLWDDGQAVKALGDKMAKLVVVMKQAAAWQKIITQARQEEQASKADVARLDQIQKKLAAAAEKGDRAAFNKLLDQLNEITGKHGVEAVTPAKAPAAPKGGGGGKKKSAKPEPKQFTGFVITDVAVITEQQQIQIEQIKELEIAEESLMEGRIRWAAIDQQILSERFAALQQLASIDPALLSPEEKAELFNLEMEQEQAKFAFEKERAEWRESNATSELVQAEERLAKRQEHHSFIEALLAQEIETAQTYKVAWAAAFETEAAGAAAVNTVRQMLNPTVAISLRQAIIDGKLSGKVIAAAVRDAALGGAAQSIVIGLLELVKGAAAAAIPFGAGAGIAAGHFTASGIAFAQAAAMTAIAAGFQSAAGGGGGASKSVGAASAGGGGGGGGGGSSGGGGGGGFQGGGAQGGNTTIINQNGPVYTTVELADELKRQFNENEQTGKWPHGLKDSD